MATFRRRYSIVVNGSKVCYGEPCGRRESSRGKNIMLDNEELRVGDAAADSGEGCEMHG
jgi:hypothetical protein